MNEDDTNVEAAASAETGAAGDVAQTTPKKKGKKKLVVWAVIGAVLVVGVVGGLIWHEQPAFCSQLCHTPMITYYETYAAEPGQPTVDKWGNDVSDASSMLAVTHRVAGEGCLDCHEPTIGEQVNEGIHWVTGDYQYPLSERSLRNLVQAHDGRTNDEFCMNESCHHVSSDGTPIDSRAALEEATADYSRNPHEPVHGEVDCGECHKAHRASVNYCSQCHADAPIPEGWLSFLLANQILAY